MKREEIKKRAEPITVVVDDADDRDDEPTRGKAAGTQGENHDLRNILIFLIVLLVISGMAYLAYTRIFLPIKQGPVVQQESYDYNSFTFTKNGPLWQTTVQVGNKLITVPVHYGPREIKWIEIIGYLNRSFDEGPVYITFNPERSDMNTTSLAAAELALTVTQGIDREVVAACSKNITAACSTRPIVNCADTDKAVIYLFESNETIVQFNNNCIVVMGKGDNLIRSTDRLILYWYRIMKKDESQLITATPQIVQK